MSNQSQGGKVRQSEKHLGSPSEWDRGDSRSAPEKGHSPKLRGRAGRDMAERKEQGLGETGAIPWTNKAWEWKNLSYKVQIKEGDVHGHSSTRHCARILGCQDTGILGYWDVGILGF